MLSKINRFWKINLLCYKLAAWEWFCANTSGAQKLDQETSGPRAVFWRLQLTDLNLWILYWAYLFQHLWTEVKFKATIGCLFLFQKYNRFAPLWQRSFLLQKYIKSPQKVCLKLTFFKKKSISLISSPTIHRAPSLRHYFLFFMFLTKLNINWPFKLSWHERLWD